MVKKQLIYLFNIFCSFILLLSREKKILPSLTNNQEPEPFFWPLGAGAARKEISGAGAVWGSIFLLKVSSPPPP